MTKFATSSTIAVAACRAARFQLLNAIANPHRVLKYQARQHSSLLLDGLRKGSLRFNDTMQRYYHSKFLRLINSSVFANESATNGGVLSPPAGVDMARCNFSSHAFRKRRGGAKKVQSTNAPPLMNEKLLSQLERRHRTSSPEEIQVRLVLADATGGTNTMQLTSLDHAYQTAKRLKVDLIGVSLQQDPPVVKAIDYAKMEYDARKSARKKKQEQLEQNPAASSKGMLPMKEFKFKAGIADNDLNRKIDNMLKYLSKGHACQVTITSSGKYAWNNQTVVSDMYEKVLDLVKDHVHEPRVKLRPGNRHATALFQAKKSSTD